MRVVAADGGEGGDGVRGWWGKEVGTRRERVEYGEGEVDGGGGDGGGEGGKGGEGGGEGGGDGVAMVAVEMGR